MISYIKAYIIEFINLCNEMSPYLLLGFIFAGILHVYIKKEKTVKYLGKKNLRSVINAALIGIPLPLCSCGVIPTGVSFSKNGAAKGASVSFLISTPQTGVDSILVTYSMLGLPFAVVRPIIAFFTGIFGGGLTNMVDKAEYTKTTSGLSNENQSQTKFKRFLNYAFVEFLQDISKWLLIGLALAALISVVIPDDFFTTYINSPLINMLIVLAASIPLYVCATGSVPIAAVLLMKGLSPGAALVFLMAGPATNIATMTVIGNSMGRKTLITYLISIIGGAIFFGLIIDYLFPSDFFTSFIISGDHSGSHILPHWFMITSSIVLGLLIINGYIRKYFIKPKSLNTDTDNMKTIKIKVTGMTCNHCKMSVETNLKKIDGLNVINADVSNEEVEIIGEQVDLKKVEETVKGLGYEYGGILN
ncbi:MAG: permease [Bacteroidales bacterium]|nr:permease [Bacteroidales bacterium]